MQAGTLKHLISFYTRSPVEDDMGGTRFVWNPTSQTLASMKQMRAKEGSKANTIQAEKVYEFKFRYFSGLDETQQIQVYGRTFNIMTIDNIKEANKEFVVMAMEVHGS